MLSSASSHFYYTSYLNDHPTIVILYCRHVIIPKDVAKKVPKDHLMSEDEWRGIGVQQSKGWIHYMKHGPGSYPYTNYLLNFNTITAAVTSESMLDIYTVYK